VLNGSEEERAAPTHGAQRALFVTSALALLDIALVFAVFKGDVRIT
jgi:hypothetical protein